MANKAQGADAAEEDDWSSFMCPGGGTAFGRHDMTIVKLSDTDAPIMRSNGRAGRHQISIHCVSALSPLDMIDMYHGSQDATGNRVWTGSLLFLEAFARTLPMPKSEPESAAMQAKLGRLRAQAIGNRAVIELGCGTGISGISILAVGEGSPASVTFTDFDGPALDLCRRNCEANIDDKSRYSVQQLEWGSNLPMNMNPKSYDSVIATDVLYDISFLAPLMQTASKLVKLGGYFVLSHVPRASVEADNGDGGSAAVARADVLESLIVEEGANHGFFLESFLRPNELSSIWDGQSLNMTSFADVEDVGAAVLVFRRQVHCDATCMR